jgi:hypothetical protein
MILVGCFIASSLCVYSFGASITGLGGFSGVSVHLKTNLPTASIRAYGAQDSCIEEMYRRSNKYTRTARTVYDMNRWLAMRFALLAAFMSTSIATFLVYFIPQSAGNTGFSISMASKVVLF